jgi:hypothetical protein
MIFSRVPEAFIRQGGGAIPSGPPATLVADVVALLEVVIHEYTVMHSDYEGKIDGFGDAGQELMWKAINDAHRLLSRPT